MPNDWAAFHVLAAKVGLRYFQQMNFSLVQDQMLLTINVLPDGRNGHQTTSTLDNLRAGICTSLKSIVVMTRPEQQLARACEQHLRMKQALCNDATK